MTSEEQKLVEESQAQLANNLGNSDLDPSLVEYLQKEQAEMVEEAKRIGESDANEATKLVRLVAFMTTKTIEHGRFILAIQNVRPLSEGENLALHKCYAVTGFGQMILGVFNTILDMRDARAGHSFRGLAE